MKTNIMLSALVICALCAVAAIVFVASETPAQRTTAPASAVPAQQDRLPSSTWIYVKFKDGVRFTRTDGANTQDLLGLIRTQFQEIGDLIAKYPVQRIVRTAQMTTGAVQQGKAAKQLPHTFDPESSFLILLAADGSANRLAEALSRNSSAIDFAFAGSGEPPFGRLYTRPKCWIEISDLGPFEACAPPDEPTY
jgi:hypothetical protein